MGGCWLYQQIKSALEMTCIPSTSIYEQIIYSRVSVNTLLVDSLSLQVYLLSSGLKMGSGGNPGIV